MMRWRDVFVSLVLPHHIHQQKRCEEMHSLQWIRQSEGDGRELEGAGYLWE